MTIRQSPDAADPAGTNQSGLGYNLGATLAISLVIGLGYAAIATNVDHATQATLANIGIWAGIVLGAMIGLTILRHLTASGPNRGDLLWVSVVVVLAFAFAFPMSAFLVPIAAFLGHMMDREVVARSKSRP